MNKIIHSNRWTKLSTIQDITIINNLRSTVDCSLVESLSSITCVSRYIFTRCFMSLAIFALLCADMFLALNIIQGLQVLASLSQDCLSDVQLVAVYGKILDLDLNFIYLHEFSSNLKRAEHT